MIMETKETPSYWFEIAYGGKADLSEIFSSAFHFSPCVLGSKITDAQLATRARFLLNDLESKIYLANDSKIPCSTAFPGDPDPCDRGRF